MRYTRFVLLLMALATASICKAEMRCPWMNMETAAGLLNADDSPGAQSGVSEPSACVFKYEKQGAVYTLQITVVSDNSGAATVSAKQGVCTSAKVPLSGIGNEASLCDCDQGGVLEEQVVGRVRDQMFFVSISSSAKDDSAMGRTQLREKATMAAEQVAGNMF